MEKDLRKKNQGSDAWSSVGNLLVHCKSCSAYETSGRLQVCWLDASVITLAKRIDPSKFESLGKMWGEFRQACLTDPTMRS